MSSTKSQWIYSNQNEYGISKLLNIRNEPGFSFQDKKFESIPSFSTKAINIFTNSLQNGNSIKNSLKLIGYSRPFIAENIYKIFNQFEQRKFPSDDQLIIFLFDCLSFLVFESETDNVEIIQKIYTIFNQNVKSTLSPFFCDIFIELTSHVLKQSTIFDLNLLQLIIQQIVMNFSFNTSIPFLIPDIVKRCVYTKDKEMIEPVLSVLVLLFEDNRMNFDSVQISLLISMLLEYINKMNPNALIILGYSSQKFPHNDIIQDPYRTLPSLLFNYYSQNKSIYFKTEEIFIQQEIDDEPVSTSEEMFNSPPEDLIATKQTIPEICNRMIQNLANNLIAFINLSSPICVKILIDSFYGFKSIFYESEYQIDIFVVLMLLLESLASKSPIIPCIQLFTESPLFSPKYTIFNKGGLNPTLNIIRDSMFNIISKINQNFFVYFIDSSSNFPFLLAEYIMRLSYKYGNSFFKNSLIMVSLFCGLNILQQMTNTKSKTYANNIILTAVFSLLDDYSVASVCFSDESFCSSFLNLFFEQNISEIALNAFTKIISNFDYLPEATINLLSTIFQMCAKKTSDAQFKNIAKNLIKSLISAMSHKVSIRISISPIFDKTLVFLTSQSAPNNETLEMTLMICSLITQSQKSIEVSSQQNNMILDVLEAVEGTEPSDSTLMSLMNQMNASTNITPGQMFIIQTPAVIPIILAAFSRSKRLDSIINLFYQLASFSVRNIKMCHDGDLCYILLQALKNEFEYNGRILKFIINEETSNDIFKLVCFITSFRSSVKINNVFVSLILPNEKTGRLNKYAEKAATSLHRVFSSNEKSDYQISNECPVFSVKDFDGSRLNYSFAFCFYAAIDTNYIFHYFEKSFIFLKITDGQNHSLKIYLKNDLLCSEYEGQIAKWHFHVESNHQVFISVFFMTDDSENNTICYYKFGKEMSEDIPFRNIQFDKNATIEIGLTESFSIASDDISPVSFGKFALILPPYDDGMFNKLELNRFNSTDLSAFEKVCLFSENLEINERYHRTELSLPKLLPCHLNLHSFDSIFKNCDNLPLLFTETALEILFLATKFFVNKKFFPSLFSLSSDKVDKNDFPVFNFTRHFFDKRYCELRINDITYILSNFVQSKYSSHPSVFTLFLKAIESSSNKSFQYEMLENFIFNFFFWDSQNVQNYKKNLRHLNNFLIDFSIAEGKSNLLSEFLIQTYFINGDFSKILELLPVNESDIDLIISIILYLNQKFNATEDEKERTEIESQMFKYFENLIVFMMNHKNIKINQKALIYFIENISKCSSEQIIQEAFTFVHSLNYENDKLFISLLIICSLNSKFIFPFEYPNIVCIHAIKTGDISRLTKINKPFYNWQFWLTFTSVFLSSQILIQKMVSFLQPNYTDNYCQILCYFEILRMTKAFHNIHLLKEFFISSALEKLIAGKSEIIIQITLYSFYSIFHKLRTSPHSKWILQLYDQFNNVPVDLNQDEKKKNNLKDFDFEKMASIFPETNKLEAKMRFWASHSHSIDKLLLLKVKKCLSLPRNEIENLPIASLINIFINDYLRDNKIPPNANTLFAYLDSGDNQVRISFENKLNQCWNEINELLNYKRTSFDYIDLFEGSILIEKLRKQKIHEIFENNYNFNIQPVYRFSIDDENHLDFSFRLNPCRFIKFPFPEKSIKIKVSTSLRNLKILGFRGGQNHGYFKENFCFYCHVITFSGPIEATLHILENEFLLFYMTKRIYIPFNEVRIVSMVRKNCMEIFTEGCFSYLISLSQDDYQIVLEMSHFPFTILFNKEDAKKKIIKQYLKNKTSVFNLILSLNLISGRSFNDIGYFPVFPIVADKSLDFSIVSNREYPKVVEKWFDYIYGDDKKKITENKNSNLTIRRYQSSFSFEDDENIDKNDEANKNNSNIDNIINNENEIGNNNNNNTNNNDNNKENNKNNESTNNNNNNDNNKENNKNNESTNNNNNSTSNNNNNKENNSNNDSTNNNNYENNKDNNNENNNNNDTINNNNENNNNDGTTIKSNSNINNNDNNKNSEDNNNNNNVIIINDNDIDNDNTISNTDKKLMTWSEFLQDARNSQNCFSPLFYTVYDNFIDSFSDKSSSEMTEIVYLMKKRIENSAKVKRWIQAFFDIQLDNSPPSKKKNLESSRINLSHKVVISSFFENSEDTFAVLYDNGKIELLFIHENATKSLKKFLDTFQVRSTKMNLISLRNFVFLYDSQKYVFHRISINNFNYIENISYLTYVTHIISVNDQLILVIDRHQIVSFESEKFPHESKVLFVENSEIEQIEASSSFDVISFSTSDGKLKVISSKANDYSTCLLSEINLNTKCQKILITKENGFIIAKTKDEIFAFSLNGRILGKANNKHFFVQAITATSLEKADFVLFIDEKNQLNAFEAFSPESIIPIVDNLPKISSMTLNRGRNMLYLITYDGNILAIPICF